MQSVGVIVIGAIAALIAYLQWVTAHQRVVLDLFDRRKSAFDQLEKAIGPVFASANVSDESFNNLIRAKSACRFLFGTDVNEYILSLQADFAYVRSFTDEVIDQKPEHLRGQFIDRKYACLDRITSFHETALPIFSPYMHISLKMRYFPVSQYMGRVVAGLWSAMACLQTKLEDCRNWFSSKE